MESDHPTTLDPPSGSDATPIMASTRPPTAPTRIALVVVGRATFDLAAGRAAGERVARLLRSAPGLDVAEHVRFVEEPGDVPEAVAATYAQHPDVIVVLYGTFADDRTAAGLAATGDVPLLLWSLPEARSGARLRRNALCGANLAAFELHRRGHRYAVLHADPCTDDAATQLHDALVDLLDRRFEGGREGGRPVGARTPRRSVAPDAPGAPDAEVDRVVAGIGRARIGLVGTPPPGFGACLADPGAIREATGATVDAVELDLLFEAAGTASRGDVEAVREELAGAAVVDRCVDRAELERSLRLRAALRLLVDERGWDAVAVRCWPECIVDYGAAACAPLALTTAAGVPAVCEADVLGALTALTLGRLARTDPFVADLVDVDDRDDTSVVWHCGCAPPSLASERRRVIATGHPIKGCALANDFALGAGPVTVARLSRAGGPTAPLTLVTAEAALIDRAQPFTGTCGVLRWSAPVGDVLADVLGRGMEHHLALVAGHHGSTLAALAGRWAIPHRRLGVPTT